MTEQWWFSQLDPRAKDVLQSMPPVPDSDFLDRLPSGSIIQAHTTNVMDAFTGHYVTLFKNRSGEWRILDMDGAELVDRGIHEPAEVLFPAILVRFGRCD